MFPIYKFELAVNGTSQQAFPVYGTDLTLNFEKDANQEFFRRKLSGKLTFIRSDYNRIVAAPFDAQFGLTVYISQNGGQSWANYWNGIFYKTDCTFDADSKTVAVTPQLTDRYVSLLAGMDKEFNLIDLVPAMSKVSMVRRPMIQIYVPGDKVITNVLSSMSWESEVDPISNESDLQSLYHFGLVDGTEQITVSGAVSPSSINGTYASTQDMNGYYIYSYVEDVGVYDPDEGYVVHMEYVQEVRLSNTAYWVYRSLTGYNFDDATYTPVSGMASGDLRIQRQSTSIYMRWVMDTPTAHNKTPFPIVASDPVYDNRNYRYVYPYVKTQTVIYYNNQYSSTPTKYGLYQPGQYYLPPTVSYGTPIPVGRSQWGMTSIWYLPTQALEWQEEQSMQLRVSLGDAYPLSAVISALLGQIAPGITHQATETFSQFLYGVNPISNDTYRLCITPKSNVLTGNYTNPAQRAMITFADIANMLRDCFRCFWWVDDSNRLRIEHISYFMKGGTYDGTPSIGIDLTAEIIKRNGKSWAFGKSTYSFDKVSMPERYEFGWMDEVTTFFMGAPLDVASNYVQKGAIESIIVSKFTSDVDYMMLNPGACSKDGFALLAVVPAPIEIEGGEWTEIFNDMMVVTFDPSYFATPGCRVTVNSRNLAADLVVRFTFFANDQQVYDNLSVTIPGQDGQTVITCETPANIDKLRVSYRSGSIVGEISVTNIEPTDGSGVEAGELPFTMDWADLNVMRSQNGNLAFQRLAQFYMYDMPAANVTRGGSAMTVVSTARHKVGEVNYPCISDPDLIELVKTNIGNGQISKLSLNLSSRNAKATLKYDTE